MKTLAQKIQELPQLPGVYVFKDAKGLVLYVGKAVRLKSRVSSYFRENAHDTSSRIGRMVSQIADLDYTVTDNEVESLILENNFIKQFRPKYNVRLRDDKNYIFIKIGLNEEIPTFSFEHKASDKASRYFGPYTAGGSARETMKMIRRIFPYCANPKVTGKPCFYYYIQKCPGVCFGKISPKDYRKSTIEKIVEFLEGRQADVIKELQSTMKYLAKHEQYERAAKVRDQLFAIQRISERQKLVSSKKISQDIFSLHLEGQVAAVNLFIIRDGKLIQKENFILDNAGQMPKEEIMESFLTRYYLDAGTLPKEVVIPSKVKTEELTGLLGERAKNLSLRFLPKITLPSLGKKRDLVRLGEENAEQFLKSQSDKKLLEEARLVSSLKELQRVLGLPKLPARMEAYDISNIQGTNAVGSMVVFDFGRPKKEEYRKFKIRTKQTPDDFAMMAEMLARRFKHSRVEMPQPPVKLPANAIDITGENAVDGTGKIVLPREEQKKSWPLPDLVIVDGGKGQLSAAQKILADAGMSAPMIGLAKRLEEIYLPDSPLPITLPKNSIALFLLQRIRDEAHRFAVRYHRILRSSASVRSLLDDIPGIGPAKKKALLVKFRSISKLRDASLTEISNSVGRKLAEIIKASL